jgi:hypothetical protein
LDVAELLLESCVEIEKPIATGSDEALLPPPPAETEGATTGANASAE